MKIAHFQGYSILWALEIKPLLCVHILANFSATVIYVTSLDKDVLIFFSCRTVNLSILQKH